MIAAVILVLAFGNPAYHDWVTHHTDEHTALGFFLAAAGAMYGLFVGWIIGIATLGGRR